jgi:hypothetical protein
MTMNPEVLAGPLPILIVAIVGFVSAVIMTPASSSLVDYWLALRRFRRAAARGAQPDPDSAGRYLTRTPRGTMDYLVLFLGLVLLAAIAVLAWEGDVVRLLVLIVAYVAAFAAGKLLKHLLT